MARLNSKGRPIAAGKAVSAKSREIKTSATLSPSISSISVASTEDFKRILDQTDIQDLYGCRDIDTLLSKAEKMILGRADMSEATISHSASGIESIWQLVADYKEKHPASASKIEQWRSELNNNLGEDGIDHWLTLAQETRKRITTYEGVLQDRWRISSKDILDSKYYPEKKDLSKGIMQNLAELSKHATPEERRTLLLENINKRCRLRARPHGMSKDEVLTLTDATSSVKEAKKRKAADHSDSDVQRPTNSRRKLNTKDSTFQPSNTNPKAGLAALPELPKGTYHLDALTASPSRQHQSGENDQRSESTTTQSHHDVGQGKGLQPTNDIQAFDREDSIADLTSNIPPSDHASRETNGIAHSKRYRYGLPTITSDTEHLAEASLVSGVKVNKPVSQDEGDNDKEIYSGSDSMVCSYILNPFPRDHG